MKKELDRATNVNVGCSDELEQLSSSKLCLRALAAAMRVRAAQNLAQRLRRVAEWAPSLKKGDGRLRPT